ncbi:MAG: fimbria major subunit, partial [Tannerellaceae bacterium]|nr:fimbria major subunit [Tannerellaceae bacterium]
TEDPTEYLADYATAEGWPVTLLVDKYEKGICYYRLPLYNNNTNAELAPYTVKRNTYYMIDIESVMDAGYTDEDKGGGGEPVDPEEPLEAQSEIKVSIKVEDWEEVKQGGNL